MAPLPKRRLSRQRGRERLEGQNRTATITQTLTVCSNCKKATVAHKICVHCGYYRGRKMNLSL